MQNFCKLLVAIVICNEKQTNWLYKQNYVKTSLYFYRKPYYVFFKCRKNWKGARTWIWQILQVHFLGDDIKNYFITTSALDFEQLYILYKFYPIKRIYLSERICVLAQTFNSATSQKNLYIRKSAWCFSLETNA